MRAINCKLAEGFFTGVTFSHTNKFLQPLPLLKLAQARTRQPGRDISLEPVINSVRCQSLPGIAYCDRCQGLPVRRYTEGSDSAPI